MGILPFESTMWTISLLHRTPGHLHFEIVDSVYKMLLSDVRTRLGGTSVPHLLEFWVKVSRS